ncbi:hypothetical protein TRICI_005574 [Trichomonascus ciferrii]|uniref:Reverse transcriptase Ty1/copia-type domain-containing protein n=1 Tax=Trichomonascus ciferrii TaxID=44093 RepID=A0A642UWJ5_9ASCO|nr:hypothetical protein TRICI_005574 [Trichomonascus ciferrii]
MGFASVASSQNIYRKGMGPSLVIVAIYVDGLLVIGYDKTRVSEMKASIGRLFQATGIGAVNKFLGLEVESDFERWSTKVTGYQYIAKMLN